MGAQIQNYLEFGWNNYFHWFRKDEQAPCRYETFTIICFYILAVPLYTGLKIYGKNYLYQALSWQVIIPEWLLYIFVYLYFLFKQKNIILTLGCLGNAILGAILFLPLRKEKVSDEEIQFLASMILSHLLCHLAVSFSRSLVKNQKK